MLRRMTGTLVSRLVLVPAIMCSVGCIVSGPTCALGSSDTPATEGVAGDHGHRRVERVRSATAVRHLIVSLCREDSCGDLVTSLKRRVPRDTVLSDSSLGDQVLRRLDSDSSFIRDCAYVADLNRNWNSVPSKHFLFFFRDHDGPDTSAMQKWDANYQRLSDAFGVTITEKIPVIIDSTEQYGRSFPPWEVRWGIRQDRVGDNCHELVHMMLFGCSDVPFFHEPLAFIYGTDANDPRKVSERVLRYERIIADSGYVPAVELLHFPQIIGLQKAKWASSFCFIEELVRQYGVEKLLTLMGMTPWDRPVNDFSESFRKVYGTDLKEFEHGIRERVGR
jgi:hypothetical protein